MGLALIQGKPVEQPLQLPAVDFQGSRRILVGPLKGAPFQPAVMEPEPIVVPLEDLEFIPFAIAKREKTRRKRVQFELLFDQYSEPVDGLAQVGASTGEIDPLSGIL